MFSNLAGLRRSGGSTRHERRRVREGQPRERGEGGASFGPSSDVGAFVGNRADYQYYDACVVKPGSDDQTTGMTRLTTNPGQDALAVGGDGGKRVLFLSDRA